MTGSAYSYLSKRDFTNHAQVVIAVAIIKILLNRGVFSYHGILFTLPFDSDLIKHVASPLR